MQILLISAITDVIKMLEDNRKKVEAMGMMGGFNPFGHKVNCLKLSLIRELKNKLRLKYRIWI